MHGHRSLVTLAAVAAVTVGFAGCSSDSSAVTTRRSNTTTIAYPADADTAIVWVGDSYSAPGLVIGGDG